MAQVSSGASGSRLWVGFGAAFVAVAILSPASSTRAAAPEDDLPEGEGKKILVSSCTACHDLSEVTKFRGYYDRKQWRDIVEVLRVSGPSMDRNYLGSWGNRLGLSALLARAQSDADSHG